MSLRGEVGREGSLRPKTRMIIIIEITGNTYGLNPTRPIFRFRPLLTYTAKERIAKGATSHGPCHNEKDDAETKRAG